MKDRIFSSLLIKLIVGLILILYILFLYMDFYNVKAIITSESIKYLCILLCFLISILSTKNSHRDKVNDIDIRLLVFGLFITIIADLCLIVLDFYILGVIFFTLVQVIYCVRYINKNIKATLIKLFISFLLIVFSYEIAILFIEKINILIPISLFYTFCLLSSVIKAIKASNNNLYTTKSKHRIVLGMIFFLLCDTCVALSNIPILFPLSGYIIIRFQSIAYFLIWVFYVPSQLLLALSGNGRIS
ncbi:lysoplasmalogenase family protein [Clostridium sp.]|uniref:lysoplasmalogenase family protein n=1 Tax=Clostridium sp. TaxID=1506 RepID=UPI003D6DA1DB